MFDSLAGNVRGHLTASSVLANLQPRRHRTRFGLGTLALHGRAKQSVSRLVRDVRELGPLFVSDSQELTETGSSSSQNSSNRAGAARGARRVVGVPCAKPSHRPGTEKHHEHTPAPGHL